jgi:hypothetical protein
MHHFSTAAALSALRPTLKRQPCHAQSIAFGSILDPDQPKHPYGIVDAIGT